MEKINVLVLITVMDRAGAETMMMNYLRHIDRGKIHMDFLINRPERADYEDEVEKLGSKIYHMCALYPGKFRRYRREFRSFLEEHNNYDVIHSNLEEKSYYTLKIAKEMGIKVRIAHAHSAPKGHDLKMVMRLYFRKKMQKYCTHRVACGEKAAKWLFGDDINIVSMKGYVEKSNSIDSMSYDGMENKTVVIMKNAIDTKKFRHSDNERKNIRIELGIDRKTLVIGHVGRFVPVKNQSFLIDIFKTIHEKDPDTVLVLVGGGEKDDALKNQIKEKTDRLGLTGYVKFLGVREDVERIMQSFDVFLLPSLFEGLPVTMIEAQAAGLPCVISDKVPIQCDITGNVDVVALNDSTEKWAEVVLDKAYNFTKSDTYNKIADAGFDVKKQAKWLENFYKEALIK